MKCQELEKEGSQEGKNDVRAKLTVLKDRIKTWLGRQRVRRPTEFRASTVGK